MAAGSHRLTFGTHGELIDLVDDAVVLSGRLLGLRNLDSLAQAKRIVLHPGLHHGRSQVAFRVKQIGVYAAGSVVPTPRLTLTAGLRLDVPFLPTPPSQNQGPDQNSASIRR